MEKLKHWFVHKWGNWSVMRNDCYELQTGQLIFYVIQKRNCEVCNKMEVSFTERHIEHLKP